ALFTRWVLISSLTNELQHRGLGIANSIAEGSRSYIVTENIPELVSLLFDARLGERKQLVTYVYILDKENTVLSHTFVEPFPAQLIDANPLPDEAAQSITLLTLEANTVYDIAVPVKEGIYRIGTVHLGLNKGHIDQLIAKLRTTFLGFVSVVTLFFFYISHALVRYITRPISELIRITEDISSGDAAMVTEVSEPLHGIVDGEYGPLRPGAEAPVIRDEVQQLRASFIQITHRIRHSQVQLKESEEKYRSLFAGGPNPIFVVDRSTLIILDANPSAQETYGYGPEELVGRSFTGLGPLAVDDLPVTSAAALGEGHHYRMVSAKVQYFRKNSIPLYVNVHASPTRYQGREAIIVATTDITEMVEKDSQLIQASKMTTLGEMSAGIAHELNQPLNAIKMGSEYLEMVAEKGDRLTLDDLTEVVREISAQVDRAAGIIIRLRDFGRKADFARDRICINRPIQSVIDIVGKQLSLQNIRIRMDLDPALPMIFAHHNRLEQVIFNLVTNARDAIIQKQEAGITDGTPEIAIRSGLEDRQVFVSIADTGIGIPAAVRKSIFEAFFTTKQMGEGMGLGLSITNGIVRDYGGRIDVASEEGRGTTFRLVFPAVG
ncbi:MAG: ATP-binding protein, partial [Pseudomonadota bacterium]